MRKAPDGGSGPGCSPVCDTEDECDPGQATTYYPPSYTCEIEGLTGWIAKGLCSLLQCELGNRKGNKQKNRIL